MACYLAWRDARKELASYDTTAQKKNEYLADRLSALLRERGQVDIGFGSVREGESNIRHLIRWSNYNGRVVTFLKAHYDKETVKRLSADI